MKKLLVMLFVFAVLGLTFTANAVVWKTANQVTIAWDANPFNVEGGAIPADQIKYVVYIYNAITDPNHENAVEMEPIAETQQLITLGVEGKYLFGVKAVRIVDGENVGESTIVWSNVPPADFGAQFFLPPAAPTGFNLP